MLPVQQVFADTIAASSLPRSSGKLSVMRLGRLSPSGKGSSTAAQQSRVASVSQQDSAGAAVQPPAPAHQSWPSQVHARAPDAHQRNHATDPMARECQRWLGSVGQAASANAMASADRQGCCPAGRLPRAPPRLAMPHTDRVWLEGFKSSYLARCRAGESTSDLLQRVPGCVGGFCAGREAYKGAGNELFWNAARCGARH